MKIKHLPYPDAERTEVVDNYWAPKSPTPPLARRRPLGTDGRLGRCRNAVTQNYLDQIPFREAMRARLTELWAYPLGGAPANSGIITIFTRNDGRQNQAVLYRQASARRRAGGGIPRSQHALRGRNGCAVGHLFSERWPLLAYAASGFRFGLSDIHHPVRRTSSPRAIS